MTNRINEDINYMKYLMGYEKGVIISEQRVITSKNLFLLEQALPTSVEEIKAFQDYMDTIGPWIKNKDGKYVKLGRGGGYGNPGPNTKAAWKVYGKKYLESKNAQPQTTQQSGTTVQPQTTQQTGNTETQTAGERKYGVLTGNYFPKADKNEVKYGDKVNFVFNFRNSGTGPVTVKKGVAVSDSVEWITKFPITIQPGGERKEIVAQLTIEPETSAGGGMSFKEKVDPTTKIVPYSSYVYLYTESSPGREKKYQFNLQDKFKLQQ